MAERNPIKYEAVEHRPFAPGDTVPPWAMNLMALFEAGEGIQILDNGDGTITVVNTCCGE